MFKWTCWGVSARRFWHRWWLAFSVRLWLPGIETQIQRWEHLKPCERSIPSWRQYFFSPFPGQSLATPLSMLKTHSPRPPLAPIPTTGCHGFHFRDVSSLFSRALVRSSVYNDMLFGYVTSALLKVAFFGVHAILYRVLIYTFIPHFRSPDVCFFWLDRTVGLEWAGLLLRKIMKIGNDIPDLQYLSSFIRTGFWIGKPIFYSWSKTIFQFCRFLSMVFERMRVEIINRMEFRQHSISLKLDNGTNSFLEILVSLYHLNWEPQTLIRP